MQETVQAVRKDEINTIYKLTAQEACKVMSSRMGGLTTAEVLDVQGKSGKNVIIGKKEKSVILVFFGNFISLMAILLWVGGIVAFFAGMPELGTAIWMVNVINGVFSFWQEHRASKATEALKKMLSSYARVIRDQAEIQILTEDLVPGDIIILAEGDKISADARLLESSDLQVDQSTLTGESNAVRKTHDPVLMDGLSQSEIPNLIFAGTSISSGTAKAVVVSIGMDTMFGRIAHLTQDMKEVQSPLQKELDKLTKQISVLAISFECCFLLLLSFL